MKRDDQKSQSRQNFISAFVQDRRSIIKVLVQDFSWVHLGLGMLGNAAFFVGSIFFLPTFERMKTIGVWLFIVGAFLMLIGSCGRLLVSLWDEH